jgi:GDP-4-dehydro-6-deoxy-D-mannose reductase
MSSRRYKTIAVTGAAGFVGRHLLEHLARAADRPGRIVALDVRHGDGPADEWTTCDVTDGAQVASALKQVAPDGIIHLAGITHGDDLRAYFAVNVQACEHLLVAAAQLPQRPRVLVVGSAAQYGITTGEYEVVDETRPLLGTTPYGVSKTLQEKWALLYAARKVLPVIAVRPFNIIGPGQPPSLVPAAFLHQVAEVVDGRAKEVCCGNVSTRRDFVDVRDVVAAFWALMCADCAADGQVFNIASGEPVLISDILAACIALAEREIPVRQDPARLRAADVPTIVGDAARLRAATGWRPAISWHQSLADMWQSLRKNRG